MKKYLIANFIVWWNVTRDKPSFYWKHLQKIVNILMLLLFFIPSLWYHEIKQYLYREFFLFYDFLFLTIEFENKSQKIDAFEHFKSEIVLKANENFHSYFRSRIS